MRVGSKLFLAIAKFGRLYFDDYIGNRRTVSIEDYDISALGSVAPEGDRIFNLYSGRGIAILVDEPRQPQLPSALLRLELNIFVAQKASDEHSGFSSNFSFKAPLIQSSVFVFGKKDELAKFSV